MKTAFHQLELDQESRPLTVFRAGDRLMRYKRLAMGTLPASGELNQRLRPVLAHIPNATIIQDDIVIATNDLISHNTTLDLVLAALAHACLTVIPKKCILASEIPFWGFGVTAQGLTPDPQKVEAVQQAEHPQTRDEVTSFLCMIRSNGQFIPNLAAPTANLRDLTKNNAVFEWSDAHEAEFQNLKSAFIKDVLLRHYDTNSPTFIHVDAHYTGLSAILAQGPSIESSQAVSVASRTTRKAEKSYSQLDLEATAVDFGLRCQMPLVSLLHGAIFLASQMLSLLNQPAPKMYCQPLPPYTPTMVAQKCTKRTMGHLSIARSSEIFLLHEGSTSSTLTLIILKGTRQNAL